VSEHLAYWLFGIALGAGITAAIGRNFVRERGARVIPILVVTGLCLGLILGWAVDGFIAYVRLSAEMR
jgi:uncharacterized membrane protein YciS (DUF1049 family)